ncbi:poliovirus receptor-like [Rhinoraja longicauda]
MGQSFYSNAAAVWRMILSCFIVFHLPHFTVLTAHVVKVEGFVTGTAGDEIRLPCYLSHNAGNLKLVQVTWLKRAEKGNVNLAVFNPRFGTSYPAAIHSVTLTSSTAQNYTLTIKPLQLSDQGLYSCELNTFPSGKQESQTRVTVRARPLAEAISVPVDTSLSEVPVANCTAARGKPAAQVAWIGRNAGSVTVTETQHADGTVTVVSQYRLRPTSVDDGKNVTCIIMHKTFTDVVNLTVTLSVRYPPEVTIAGYDGNWYVGSSGHRLVCLARATPPVTSYRWTLSTGPLPPNVQTNGDRLVITHADYSLNGTWVCEATNALGKGRGKVTVVVKEPHSTSAGASFESTVVYVTVGTLASLLLVVVSVYIAMKRSRQRVGDTKEEVSSSPEKSGEFVIFATLNLKVLDCAGPSSRENNNHEATVCADIHID